jgi:hypothetical protein
MIKKLPNPRIGLMIRFLCGPVFSIEISLHGPVGPLHLPKVRAPATRFWLNELTQTSSNPSSVSMK